MDGAMIDLKCLDPDIHRPMTGEPNDAVLASIVQPPALGLLYEVRLLLLAGVNDDPLLLRRTAEWLAAVDPTMRVKVIGFRATAPGPTSRPWSSPRPTRCRCRGGPDRSSPRSTSASSDRAPAVRQGCARPDQMITG